MLQAGMIVTKNSVESTTTLLDSCRRRFRRQSMGTTNNNHKRHFVTHDYRDRAAQGGKLNDANAKVATTTGKHGGMFPLKLHDILSDAERKGFDHIISWACHGRCFKVHKPKEFVERILPLYFQISKITSFQRQLNLYGFRRLYQGPDRGSSYHECFLRGQPDLALLMVRVKIKGTCIKPASMPDEEPNFYTMTPLSPSGSNMSPPRISTPKDGRAAFPISISAKAMPIGSEICPLQPTRTIPTEVPSYFTKVPALALDVAYMFNSGTNFQAMMHTLLDAQSNSLLTNRVAPAQKPCLESCDFHQLLVACSDPLMNDIVDELFFENAIDSEMLGDFCSAWTPKIHGVSPSQTLNGNWLLAFK